jgi:CYTH domain-containing protein
VAGRKAFLTIKTAGKINRKEFEYKIPLTDAKKLLELTNLKIEKVRYFLNLNTSRWAIDFFQGVNYPLVTAEIELPSENFTVDKPLWIQKEVTLDPRFRSSYLSQHPFSNWKQ